MSADCGERKKWRARSISCDDGSGCASGVSCGRLCGGLYLGDDWPCVLLRAFESFACTTLSRRSWILVKEAIIYNRLLARSQALSGLERAVEKWNSGTVDRNSRTVARSIPPRPLPSHAPRLTPHAPRSSGTEADAARQAGYPWSEQMDRKSPGAVQETRSSRSHDHERSE